MPGATNFQFSLKTMKSPGPGACLSSPGEGVEGEGEQKIELVMFCFCPLGVVFLFGAFLVF